MNHQRHALGVGGTGMLADACLRLARDGWRVSVIARSRDDLAALAARASHMGGVIDPLPLDYHDSAALKAAIEGATASHGPIGLVLAWIHSTAPHAPRLIAETIAASSRDFRFVHILGSSTVDPYQPDAAREQWIARIAGMRYQRVILGFTFQRSGPTRWLTDDEICAGIERAIAADQESTIVGVIEPWERRP